MARPIKDGVSYWPFDVDMLEDKKFKLLRGEFGVKGAYVALVILNSVYKDNGYYKHWDEEDCLLTSDGIGDGCTPRLVGEILRGCVRRGLFDQRLFQTFGILTSAGIQRRFLRMVKNSRNRIVLIKEYLLLELNEDSVPVGVLNKVVLKTVSRMENPNKTQGNPDNLQENPLKEKEIEKEIEIERESKGVTPSHFQKPTFEEVKAYSEERGGIVDAVRFFNNYESSGWLLGNGVPMQDWKATMRKWETSEKNKASVADEPSEYEKMVAGYTPVYKKKGSGD